MAAAGSGLAVEALELEVVPDQDGRVGVPVERGAGYRLGPRLRVRSSQGRVLVEAEAGDDFLDRRWRCWHYSRCSRCSRYWHRSLGEELVLDQPVDLDPGLGSDDCADVSPPLEPEEEDDGPDHQPAEEAEAESDGSRVHGRRQQE